MSRQSEEVLLIVNHVKNKKKISPDTKEKVQLQLVMHDGGANTFQLNNPKGRAAQVADRDSVKELLQQLLPKFRRKLSNELEEKNRLLQENPELFQLYKDLVVSQVITAEEFWATQAPKYSAKEKVEQNQTTGVSAAFLADIKPETDGCNGLKYNLTADIIESIFRTYPMVKKKHAEYVPHEMSESEFWTRFFQSHYFHRDRIAHTSKDLFSDCAKKDEDEIKMEVQKRNTDPLLDISSLKDGNIGDGYGGGIGEDRGGSASSANMTMIRRFNHHSTMVLKACEQAGSQATTASSQNGAARPANGSLAATQMNGETSHSHENTPKKARIREKLQFNDLEVTECRKTVNMRLSRMERYLHGPTPITSSRYTSSEDLISANNTVSAEIDSWNPNLTHVLLGSSAVTVLGELSPGGALMHGSTQQQLNQMVPDDVQQELKQSYSALCELLRHFWACFPASNKLLEEKLTAHMQDLLNAAYTKFETWQSRRMLRKS
ncbi:TF2H1-like protein [Mya arenaria]|uniref:TF2H1-like protein n=1 Tax=Mya arenaria TaxID=6604 RepID=A0ABY7E2L1_MYAAR|nr:TF2H1-like protein [Mya arenaria]